MRPPKMNEPNVLTMVGRERLELFLAQALSELTDRTASVKVTTLDPINSEKATLSLEVLFLPENPEEGTEH